MQISFRILIPILLFVTESTIAIKFDNIIAFGDSYSDNGDGVFNVSNGNFPPPPYYEGRFTNGLVWVEYLSEKLDSPLVDRASGGATVNSVFVPSASGINDEIEVPGIRQQVSDFMTKEQYNEFRKDKKHQQNNLFVVAPFVGNDYIYSIRHGTKMIEPVRVMGELITNLQTLTIEFGASYIMVTNLPDLSNFPGFSKSNETEKAFLSKLVEKHNELLKESIPIYKRDFKKSTVFLLDVNRFFQKFDSEEFEKSCLSIDRNGAHACDDPDEFLFWDNLNVNTKIHEMLASVAFTCTQTIPPISTAFQVC